MMFLRMTMILIIGLNVALAAEIQTAQRSVEITDGNLTVPTTPNARLSFKPCAGICDEAPISARLQASTTYMANGEAIDFKAFRAAFFNRKRGEHHYVLVTYDVKTMTVISVQFEAAPAE